MLGDGPKWHKRYPKDTKEGEKIYYCCDGYRDCPKILYLLLHADRQEVTAYICDSHEHKHEDSSNSNQLPKESKAKRVLRRIEI
jgi:hypothetical protein